MPSNAIAENIFGTLGMLLKVRSLLIDGSYRSYMLVNPTRPSNLEKLLHKEHWGSFRLVDVFNLPLSNSQWTDFPGKPWMGNIRRLPRDICDRQKPQHSPHLAAATFHFIFSKLLDTGKFSSLFRVLLTNPRIYDFLPTVSILRPTTVITRCSNPVHFCLFDPRWLPVGNGLCFTTFLWPRRVERFQGSAILRHNGFCYTGDLIITTILWGLQAQRSHRNLCVVHGYWSDGRWVSLAIHS